MKELVDHGDARGLDAIGAMAFPEATETLIELTKHSAPAIAAKAMQLLVSHCPPIKDSKFPTRLNYLGARAWNDRTRAAVTATAWKKLAENDRQAVIDASRIVQSLGGKDDLPALIKVMDRVLPFYKNDPVEQRAYPRPQSASGSLSAPRGN